MNSRTSGDAAVRQYARWTCGRAHSMSALTRRRTPRPVRARTPTAPATARRSGFHTFREDTRTPATSNPTPPVSPMAMHQSTARTVKPSSPRRRRSRRRSFNRAERGSWFTTGWLSLWRHGAPFYAPRRRLSVRGAGVPWSPETHDATRYLNTTGSGLPFSDRCTAEQFLEGSIRSTTDESSAAHLRVNPFALHAFCFAIPSPPGRTWCNGNAHLEHLSRLG